MRSFSTQKKQKEMPEFLNYYGKLFNDSMILERIIPRQVDNASLEETFPYLFTEHYKSEFPKADV